MPRQVTPNKVPNPSVNRTPGKLRLPVPSALRAPVAGYFERCRGRFAPATTGRRITRRPVGLSRFAR